MGLFDGGGGKYRYGKEVPIDEAVDLILSHLQQLNASLLANFLKMSATPVESSG